MNVATKFTWHGEDRLTERCSLTTQEVGDVISSGLALNILKETGTNRVHWLIWSDKDQRGVIVVRDEVTKEIITTLLDHYEGVEYVNRGLVELAKRLRTFPFLCSLDDVNLRSLQMSDPYLGLKVIAIANLHPRGGRVIIRNIQIPLSEILNIRSPSRDPEIFRRLSVKFKSRIYPVEDEIVIRQLIFILGENEAVKAFLTFKQLQRPVL